MKRTTTAMPTKTSPLPYTDTKPVGASDFYMAINATFRFVQGRFGMAVLKKYWEDLGAGYFAGCGPPHQPRSPTGWPSIQSASNAWLSTICGLA
ncbi:MAG: hypothetical protein ACOYM3_29530 [Terrimicrobiaceae bacterium]